MNSIRKNFTKSFYIYIYENEKGIPIYVGRGCGDRIKTHLTIALRRKKPHPFYFKLRKMLQNGIKPKYKRRWINNGEVNKFIHFSKVQEYIEKGWVRGQRRRQL